MVKKANIKIATPSFLLLAILLVGLIYNLNREPFQDIRSAAEEEDPNFCQNHCKPDAKRCDFNDTSRHEDDSIINDPCCEEIAKTGDPGACPWPQRGYCTDGQCAAIPEGVSRERCGGPRHSWCNLCNEKCSGSSKVVPTQQPKVFIPPPTSAPISTPTPIPSDVPPTNQPSPMVQPTQIIEPPRSKPQITYIPIIIPPYTPPTLTPTPTPIKFNLPNILPPKEKVQSFLEGIRLNLLDFFSKILP